MKIALLGAHTVFVRDVNGGPIVSLSKPAFSSRFEFGDDILEIMESSMNPNSDLGILWFDGANAIRWVDEEENFVIWE